MGCSTKAYQYQALWRSVNWSRSWNKATYKRGTHASTCLHPALVLRLCLLTPLANLQCFNLFHIQFDALSLAVLYYANPLFIMGISFDLRLAHERPLSNNATRPQKTGWVYTGCPRRNVQYFGRVFLMLNYTDITQNTYIQSW